MDKETAINHWENCLKRENDSFWNVTWEVLKWITEQIGQNTISTNQDAEVFVVPKPYISVYRFCEETYFNSTSLYRILRNYTVPDDVLKTIGGTMYVHPHKLIEFCLKKKGRD